MGLSDTGHSPGRFCKLAHSRRELDGTWLGPQLGLLVTTPTLSHGLFTRAFVRVRWGGGFPSALEAGFKSEHSTIQEETETVIS